MTFTAGNRMGRYTSQSRWTNGDAAWWSICQVLRMANVKRRRPPGKR
jgi:hypothetical protein